MSFEILYDLRDPGACARARRHRSLWGKLYTDAQAVDHDHVLLVFRPAPNPRWRKWEEVRKRWIMEEANKVVRLHSSARPSGPGESVQGRGTFRGRGKQP